jgi:hypothetical protein
MLVLIGLVCQFRDGLDFECLARSKIVEMCRGTAIWILLYEKGDIRAVRSADRCVRTERWEPRSSGCVTCEK